MLALSLALPSSRPPVGGGGGSSPVNVTPPSISSDTTVEVTLIVCGAQVSGSLDGSGFDIDSVDGVKTVRVNDTADVTVTLGSDESEVDVAIAIKNAMEAAFPSLWTIEESFSALTVTDNYAGSRTSAVEVGGPGNFGITPSQTEVFPVGATLTRTEGVWDDADTIAGNWQHDQGTGTWTNIAGETGATYEVQAIYAGEMIRWNGVATNGAGSTSAPSNEVGPVTPVLLASVSAGSSNMSDVTTGSIDTMGASLIVAAVGSYPPLATGDFSDSEGNTWTPLTLRTPVSGVGLQLFYCINPDTSAAHTFSSTVASSFPAVAVLAFAGGSSFDEENGASVLGSPTLQAGSVTPAENYSIVVAGFSFNLAGSTASIDGAYALPEQVSPTNNACVGVAIAYEIQSTASATNPQFTAVPSQSSEGLAAGIAVFAP